MLPSGLFEGHGVSKAGDTRHGQVLGAHNFHKFHEISRSRFFEVPNEETS